MKLKKLTTDDYLSVVENYRMFDIKSNCVDFGIEEMRERIRRYYHDFFVISTEKIRCLDMLIHMIFECLILIVSLRL